MLKCELQVASYPFAIYIPCIEGPRLNGPFLVVESAPLLSRQPWTLESAPDSASRPHRSREQSLVPPSSASFYSKREEEQALDMVMITLPTPVADHKNSFFNDTGTI